MKHKALFGETVGDFLFRTLGDDNDELEEAFYELNKGQSSRFLEQGKVYELPNNPETEQTTSKQEVSRWQ